MTTPDEFAPDDAAPTTPAPAPAKKSHKKKPAPAPFPSPEDPKAWTEAVRQANTPVTSRHVTSPDAPPAGAPSMGMKDPIVIRWHLAQHPERMEQIYGSYDWRAQLGRHADIPTLED